LGRGQGTLPFLLGERDGGSRFRQEKKGAYYLFSAQKKKEEGVRPLETARRRGPFFSSEKK